MLMIAFFILVGFTTHSGSEKISPVVEADRAFDINRSLNVEKITYSNVDLKMKERVNCWELADAAETVLCGEVGCDDEFWMEFYEACECFVNHDVRYC